MWSPRLLDPFWSALRGNRSNGVATPRRRPKRRLGLESLEDRRCLSSYAVVDVGTLGAWSDAYSLNEAGQVVGQVHTTNAFFWENGLMTDLGTMGEDSSAAWDINESGQVVGAAGGLLVYGDEMPPSHAFLWEDGVMTDIGGPDSQAYAINDAGQIAGYAVTGNWAEGAAVWEGGVRYNLNSLLPAGPAMQLTRAYDLNNQGQIVGLGYVNGSAHHFLFTDDDGIFANGGGVLTDLGTLDAYEPSRINNAGQVIAGRYLYSHGTVTHLGFTGLGINDAGQVVGHNWPRALMWENGQVTDLTSRIDASSGWVLNSAAAINERGEIVGTGTIGGQYHAFLLVESSLPAVTISNAFVPEGHTGSTSAVFTVSLSAPSEQAVTVAYATADSGATAGSDYEAVWGTVTFEPGETSKAIVVSILGDTRDEFDETFNVNLGSPTNAILSDSQAEGTILDDDPSPSLSIMDVTLVEGHSGSTLSIFTVSLSAASNKTVSVNFATANGTASSNDYVAASGYVMFAPGETIQTITVQVKGDGRDEVDETFLVNLSSPSAVTLADSQGVGVIVDDDLPPSLAISNVARSEGRSGVTYFVFTVSLSAASDKSVSVNFATANGTAKTSDNDYVATSGTLTFAPGETIKTITVQVKGDRKKEANETFFVNLSAAVDAVFADSQGLGTILNDD